MEVQIYAFLTSVLDGGECPISRPGRLTPERAGYPLDRRMDASQSRSGRGGQEKKIPSLPLQGKEHWSPSP
jgi:hypothetical protein